MKIPKTEYGRGVDTISVLKDISPPPPSEPTVLPLESIVEVLKNQTSVYKERLVTGTYIGRNIKQVSPVQVTLLIQDSICTTQSI